MFSESGRFLTQAVDVIFTKAKSVGTQQKLTFREFQSALAYLAAQKRTDYASIAERVVKSHATRLAAAEL